MDKFIDDILGGVVRLNIIPGDGEPGSTAGFILNLLSNGLILLLTAIIIVAIVFSALAGFKYISSQGDAEKVEEAQNSIKNVFIGVLAVFIGIIAVVLISCVFTNPGADQIRQAICTFVEPTTAVKDCVEGIN